MHAEDRNHEGSLRSVYRVSTESCTANFTPLQKPTHVSAMAMTTAFKLATIHGWNKPPNAKLLPGIFASSYAVERTYLAATMQ
jgi:hypothetical protein